MTNNMTTPLLIANGDGYDIQPAGVLLILADMVYGPQDNPQCRRRGATLRMPCSLILGPFSERRTWA